jgi:hydrogenase maturation protease
MAVLILGIGNILWADEGFGVRAVEAFHRLYDLPDDVVLLDGGTQGLYLVNYVQEADDLLVFDAIDYGLPPGTLKIVRDDEVPKFTGAKKMSLHQTGFQEVLSAADLLGGYPGRLTLIGCQPVDLEDWGGPLTGRCVLPSRRRWRRRWPSSPHGGSRYGRARCHSMRTKACSPTISATPPMNGSPPRNPQGTLDAPLLSSCRPVCSRIGSLGCLRPFRHGAA